MSRTRRLIATVLAASLTFAGAMQSAQAALIGTEQVAAAQTGVAGTSAGHAALQTALARADVSAALQARGVDAGAARERIAALTDAEAAQLAQQIDQAPAGADALGVILTVFIVLLITDILGWTKVFPFTRAIR